MLDYRFIRDNIDAVNANVKDRSISANPSLVVSLFESRNQLITQLDKLREARNKNAKLMKTSNPPNLKDTRDKLIAEGKELKTSIANKESEMEKIKNQLEAEALKIPNMAHPDAPRGHEEKHNLQTFQTGTPTSCTFPPLDHVKIASKLKILDFDAGAKVSGSKFYFLRNQGVILELALTRYALDILQKHNFTLTLTPDIAKEEIAEGIGFNPRGTESNIYTLEGTKTCLIGTAEIPLGGYHANDIIDLENGPILMAGLSHCFRREAGSAGQYSKGLYRVHQFTKVEMFVYCKNSESDDLQRKLLAIEEEIFKGLGIPYRVVDCCTGDLGAPAYRKFDIEAWMPGRGEKGDWGEVTSASNCTDYQARRLSIRYRENKQIHHAHTLNGTAMAVSRTIIAILENYQQADTSIRIPKNLVPYCGFEEIPASQ